MRRYVINKYIAVAGNANGADEQLNGAMSGQREQCQNRGENAHIFFFLFGIHNVVISFA